MFDDSDSDDEVVDEADEDGIAGVLERIARRDVDVPKIRRAARAKVAKEFNNEILNKRLEHLLENLRLRQLSS